MDSTGEPVVLSNGNLVKSLAVLVGGRLASADYGGAIKLWPKDGKGEPVVVSDRPHNTPLDTFLDGAPPWLRALSDGWPPVLAALPDGRLASGDYDGTIKLWPKDGSGEPVVLSRGNREVLSLAALPDGRMASGGRDGKIKVWPKKGSGEPFVLLHGSQIEALAALADGRLASGGEDGNIKIWPNDGRGEPLVLWHGSSVHSLAVLADGRLASGGEDGNIKIWPKKGTGEPVVLPQDSWVSSLAVLADGRLASSGRDGTIKLWLVDEQKLIAALCLRAGRNLTKAEWVRYVGSDTPRQPSCRDRPSNWRTIDP
jgi:WD40 repeat protein